MSFSRYFLNNLNDVLYALSEHFRLVLFAVLLATTIGIPLALLFSKHPKANKLFNWINGFFVMIPFIALLGLVVPLFGVGFLPSLIALVLYAVFPIIKQTYIGISNLSKEDISLAKQMGMNRWQIFRVITFPLVLPNILQGVRVSFVSGIGIATLAAYIGAGGLGKFIFDGLSTNNYFAVLTGALPVVILALIVHFVFKVAESLLTADGIKRKRAVV